MGCHAERSAALQVTRAPGRTTERGTCWTEAVLEGVHSLSRTLAGTKDTECVYVSVGYRGAYYGRYMNVRDVYVSM